MDPAGDSNWIPKFSLRTLIIVVVLSGVAATGWFYANRVNRTIRGSYAVWWAADMCIEHLEANGGTWPRSWDDLRDDYQTCVNRSGQPWTFDEIRERVEIDWDADPQQLLEQSSNESADVRVIWLRDGTVAYWQGREPNQIILDYLKSKQVP